MTLPVFLTAGALLGFIVARSPLGALMGCIAALLFMIIKLHIMIKKLESSQTGAEKKKR